jgi:hypothetical protein
MEIEMNEDKLFRNMKRDPFATYPLAKKEITHLYVSNRIFKFIMIEIDRILRDETKPEAIRIGDARQLISYTLESDEHGAMANNIPADDN